MTISRFLSFRRDALRLVLQAVARPPGSIQLVLSMWPDLASNIDKCSVTLLTLYLLDRWAKVSVEEQNEHCVDSLWSRSPRIGASSQDGNKEDLKSMRNRFFEFFYSRVVGN